MIIFAPDGIGEVVEGADLADLIMTAAAGCPQGPLTGGDIVVVTSKIVSKAEGRRAPAAQREAAIEAETVRTVARRAETRIVRTRSGPTMAAAGVDTSNVSTDQILLLPADPDRSAGQLAADLSELVGAPVGVIISDTVGRPWRVGQTDIAIGAAGIRVLESYAGRRDPYGNELRVTEIAVADELAAAADLVKAKLRGRPVAVVRGLAELVLDGPGQSAARLLRDVETDMFRYGAREAVLAAVCAITGQPDAYERLVGKTPVEVADALLPAAGLSDVEARMLRALLGAAERPMSD